MLEIRKEETAEPTDKEPNRAHSETAEEYCIQDENETGVPAKELFKPEGSPWTLGVKLAFGRCWFP